MRAAPLVSLESISESIDYGVTTSAVELAVGPKFLRITDIQDGAVDWVSVPWCECSERERAKAQLRPGDIVFARTGATTGKSYLIRDCPDDCVFASYLIRVRLSSAVDPLFISHFFQSQDYWKQIIKTARGAAQPGVNATSLAALKVPLPPLPEQRRIAKILEHAEALRSKRRVALARLDILAQSIFIEMFGDPVENSKNWNSNETLGNVAGIVSGVTIGRKVSNCATRTVPYLAVVNVQDMHIRLDILKQVEATEEEIDRYRLMRNDLLLTEGGDPDKLGRGSLWQDEVPECIHQNHVFRVRLTSEQLHPVFLNWLVGSSRGKKYFLKSAKQTTGIASINMTQLRGFPLLIPPRSLQNQFAHHLEAMERIRTKQAAALSILDALFDSLQHRAFQGEL